MTIIYLLKAKNKNRNIVLKLVVHIMRLLKCMCGTVKSFYDVFNCSILTGNDLWTFSAEPFKMCPALLSLDNGFKLATVLNLC